ncbi:MAG: right-handed parallel beta-helix repeat-containing protein [Fimbriimonadaceae bacterium]
MTFLVSLCLLGGLQSEITPESFGAKADGVTDDTIAFSQALAKGGTVVLAAGKTYRVKAPLTLRSNLTLKSSDQAKSAIVKLDTPSSGTTGVISSKTTGVTVCGIDFEGLTGDFNSLLALSEVDKFSLVQCKLSKNAKRSSALLRLKDSTNVSVTNCDFEKGYVAIHALGNSRDLKFEQNTMHDLMQYGVWLQGSATTTSERVQILNNDIWDIKRSPGAIGSPGATAGHLIYVQIGENVGKERHKQIDVVGNRLKGIKTAFTQGGNADLVEYCDVDGGNVSENVAEHGGDVGIAVIRSKGILVEKNKAGYNNTNGIVLWEASYCKVLKNEAYNNNQDRLKQWGERAAKGGIRVMARTGTSDNNELTGNKCWDDQAVKTQDYGIYLMKSAKNTKLGANDLNGNKFGPIKDDTKGMFGG